MAKDTIAIESSDPLERRTRNGNSKTRSEIGVLIEEQYGERIEVLNLPHRTWLDIILKLGRRLAGIGTSRSFLCWLVEARQRRLRVNVYRKLFSLFTEGAYRAWYTWRWITLQHVRAHGHIHRIAQRFLHSGALGWSTLRAHALELGTEHRHVKQGLMAWLEPAWRSAWNKWYGQITSQRCYAPQLAQTAIMQWGKKHMHEVMSFIQRLALFVCKLRLQEAALSSETTKRGGKWVSKKTSEWNEFQRATMYHYMLRRAACPPPESPAQAMSAVLCEPLPATHASVRRQHKFGGRRITATAPSAAMVEALGVTHSFAPLASRNLTSRCADKVDLFSPRQRQRIPPPAELCSTGAIPTPPLMRPGARTLKTAPGTGAWRPSGRQRCGAHDRRSTAQYQADLKRASTARLTPLRPKALGQHSTLSAQKTHRWWEEAPRVSTIEHDVGPPCGTRTHYLTRHNAHSRNGRPLAPAPQLEGEHSRIDSAIPSPPSSAPTMCSSRGPSAVPSSMPRRHRDQCSPHSASLSLSPPLLHGLMAVPEQHPKALRGLMAVPEQHLHGLMAVPEQHPKALHGLMAVPEQHLHGLMAVPEQHPKALSPEKHVAVEFALKPMCSPSPKPYDAIRALIPPQSEATVKQMYTELIKAMGTMKRKINRDPNTNQLRCEHHKRRAKRAAQASCDHGPRDGGASQRASREESASDRQAQSWVAKTVLASAANAEICGLGSKIVKVPQLHITRHIQHEVHSWGYKDSKPNPNWEAEACGKNQQSSNFGADEHSSEEWCTEEEDEECAWAPGSTTGRQGSDLMAAKQARQRQLEMGSSFVVTRVLLS